MNDIDPSKFRVQMADLALRGLLPGMSTYRLACMTDAELLEWTETEFRELMQKIQDTLDVFIQSLRPFFAKLSDQLCEWWESLPEEIRAALEEEEGTEK